MPSRRHLSAGAHNRLNRVHLPYAFQPDMPRGGRPPRRTAVHPTAWLSALPHGCALCRMAVRSAAWLCVLSYWRKRHPGGAGNRFAAGLGIPKKRAPGPPRGRCHRNESGTPDTSTLTGIARPRYCPGGQLEDEKVQRPWLTRPVLRDSDALAWPSNDISCLVVVVPSQSLIRRRA